MNKLGRYEILVIQESKCDSSFVIVNFLIDEISTPYPSGRDSESVKITLFIRKDIPSNRVAIKDKPMEELYGELKFLNGKWPVICSYIHFNNSQGTHLDRLRYSFHQNTIKWLYLNIAE